MRAGFWPSGRKQDNSGVNGPEMLLSQQMTISELQCKDYSLALTLAEAPVLPLLLTYNSLHLVTRPEICIFSINRSWGINNQQASNSSD